MAGAQHRGTQTLLGLVIEGEKGQHRQIAAGVVVPIEEGEWLRAMRRIVRRISVDLRASGQAGICGVIERVVFEPNALAPERVQIWGAKPC